MVQLRGVIAKRHHLILVHQGALDAGQTYKGTGTCVDLDGGAPWSLSVVNALVDARGIGLGGMGTVNRSTRLYMCGVTSAPLSQAKQASELRRGYPCLCNVHLQETPHHPITPSPHHLVISSSHLSDPSPHSPIQTPPPRAFTTFAPYAGKCRKHKGPKRTSNYMYSPPLKLLETTL